MIFWPTVAGVEVSIDVFSAPFKHSDRRLLDKGLYSLWIKDPPAKGADVAWRALINEYGAEGAVILEITHERSFSIMNDKFPHSDTIFVAIQADDLRCFINTWPSLRVTWVLD